jgi:hypothetical protein
MCSFFTIIRAFYQNECSHPTLSLTGDDHIIFKLKEISMNMHKMKPSLRPYF